MFYIIGLGNPGEEYKNGRHNTGKMAVEYFKSRVSSHGPQKFKIIESKEFMNNSGRAVAKFIKSKKTAENLIVVYDDIDLPLGTIRISYNKSSGGHRGLESIIKAVKTKEFTRIRIGISPVTAKGSVKKPGANLPPKAGEKAVLDFILGRFKPSETEVLNKVLKRVSEAIQSIIISGRNQAMNEFN